MANDEEPEIFPELDEELLNLKLFPVMVRPNLGQPDYITPLNLPNGDDEYIELPELLEFEFEGIIAACDQSSYDDIFQEVDTRMFVYPLSEKVVDGRAVRLNKIPIIIKEFQAIGIKPIDSEKYNGEPQNYLKTEKVFVGRELFFKAKFRFRAPSEIFFKELQISIGKIRKRDLRRTVMCDIVYDLTASAEFSVDSADDNYLKYFAQRESKPPEKLMRINYHAIVLSLKSQEQMESMNIWQGTDLHIAARNDKMPHSIMKRMIDNGMRQRDLEQGAEAQQNFEQFLMRTYDPDDSYVQSINQRISDKNCFAFHISDDDTPYIHDPLDLPYSNDEFFWNLPIEYRVQNCNNSLRMFIYQANEAYKRGELDLVIFTGDLVDFVSPRRIRGYEFKDSNWKVFLDILLGKPTKVGNAGLLPPEEILVPIYTIPGNHDYRGHSYPPKFCREMFGFKKEEMDLYPSSKLSYFRAISANIKYLRGYFQFINPDLNFAKKFGNTHLIFLDSDKDSLIDLFDLLKGSPSTRGLRKKQLKWLKNYCNREVKKTDNVILFSHAPPLNPPKIDILRKRLIELFPEMAEENEKTDSPKLTINLLKEYNLIDKFDDPRIDTLVNLKFGTIVRNWEEILEFCLDCKSHGINKRVNLVCSGHSHKNLEFRIQTLQGREIQNTAYIEILPFHKIDIPCAVYLGNYSLEYAAEIDYLKQLEKEAQIRRLADHNLITNLYPFLCITTALGPRSLREYSNLQGFRTIRITENRIDDFRTQPLIRYFASFELLCQKR